MTIKLAVIITISIIVIILILKYLFNPAYNYIYFYIKRQDALLRWRITGHQQWIIPVGNKLEIFDKYRIWRYNKAANIKGVKRIDILTLSANSYFCTPKSKLTKR